MSRGPVIAVAVFAPLSMACLSLLGIDYDPRERGGPPDAAAFVNEDGAAGIDAGFFEGGPDAGELPPPDFACAKGWTLNAAPAGDPCAKRKVVTIDTLLADTSTLSLARISGGRVLAVYNTRSFADEGELRIRTFLADAPEPSGPVQTLRANLEDVGAAARVVLGANDVAHIVYQNRGSGDVLLVERSAAGMLSQPLTVTTGVPGRISLALAATAGGDVRVAIGDPSTRKVSVFLRKAGTPSFGAPLVLTTWDATSLPQPGEIALVTNTVGTAKLLVHAPIGMATSRLQFFDISETIPSVAKTIDFSAFGEVTGLSPALALVEPAHHAVYFTRSVTVAGGRSDLRLASWASRDDMPVITVLEQQLPAEDPPRGEIALVSDRFGLLHLAYVSPAQSRGTLAYWRQTRDASGVHWLRDIVDDDVIGGTASGDRALVALTVDADRRPHILYQTERTNTIRYATILP